MPMKSAFPLASATVKTPVIVRWSFHEDPINMCIHIYNPYIYMYIYIYIQCSYDEVWHWLSCLLKGSRFRPPCWKQAENANLLGRRASLEPAQLWEALASTVRSEHGSRRAR